MTVYFTNIMILFNEYLFIAAGGVALASCEEDSAALARSLAAWAKLYSSKHLRMDTDASQLARRLETLLETLRSTGLCPPLRQN